MTRAALAVAVIAAVAGCKKKRDASEDVLVKMSEFSYMMCACRDKACADKVQEDLTRWGTALAKNASSTGEPPDPELAKQSADVMQRYSECLTKVMAGDVDAAHAVPEMPKPATIDSLVKAARAAASKRNKDLVLGKLEAHYVRSNGTLDTTYGSLDVIFQPPASQDDPKRPLGAPVPAPVKIDDCPYWTAAKGEWHPYENTCTAAIGLDGPRCSAAQVWARALQDEAPTAALATLMLEHTVGDSFAMWTFTVIDEPRKVNIRKSYPDDCQPVVEHP